MRCDVCDHEMAKWDLPPSRWHREIWICTWCYAVTRIGLTWLRIKGSQPRNGADQRLLGVG